ncbi:MAG: acyl-CoA dehydrogenase family protein, partial [Acidimicrobiales bacterium]
MLADYAEHAQAIGLDWYTLDPNLSFLLDKHLPDPDDRKFAELHVSEYGELVGKTLAARAEITDANGPVLHRYDRWGFDVGEVAHHPSWTANKADLVRTGFVGLDHHSERAVPAVVTAARAYLLSQCETAAYCALGMTGGAADIVERYAPSSIRDLYVERLNSLDPSRAWEGGMFLTERQGGSDVGANTTRAVPDGGEWLLFGDKHFCSNVDADVFIVLARPEGAPEGTRGLATFIVPSRQPDGSPNGFTIKRLKPKLGTVGVPTGEVTLDGARAWLAGNPERGDQSAARDGRGINRMMEMVNSSRFGVALMGLGIHRRSFLDAAIYAATRTQWGQRIDHYPLVRETLVDLLVDLEAGMAITFECAGALRNASD